MTNRRGPTLALLALLWIVASVRALWPVLHEPLYAYANSYDQTRYTSCFGFYPDRPADVEPQRNSPEAPHAKFRFIATGDSMCYWSSDLAFPAIAAAGWRIAEAAGGGGSHDVRPVALLRWGVLSGLSIAFSLAWLRRGDVRAAIANAGLLALLFADPANTLYLATFYAEPTALMSAYALVAATLLWQGERRTRLRFVLLALAAFVLATSKIQHLMLPLLLAGVVAIVDRMRASQRWRAGALATGAVAGCALQVAQLQRQTPMMDAIDQYNRADVLFTALLPFADDPRSMLQGFGIDPACARHAGDRAWELPEMPEAMCAGFERFGRGDELRALALHPGIAVRLAGAGIRAMTPWLAGNIGHVEGAVFARAPVADASLDRVLAASPPLRHALLLVPLAALAWLARRRAHRGRALVFTALVVVTAGATLAVVVLGDGLADVAKQTHLATNALLAWAIVMTIAVLLPVPRSDRIQSVPESSPMPRCRPR